MSVAEPSSRLPRSHPSRIFAILGLLILISFGGPHSLFGAVGDITTIAGDGTAGFSGDSGPATSAQLNAPVGVAVDAAGNLFIADKENHRIRKVDTAGVITTIAGDGTAGFSGDGSAATSAQLNRPYGVAVDAAGNLFIAELNNNRIRKVDTAGIITTVAGDGTAAYGGDNGAATAAQLFVPLGVAVDAAGNLFIAGTGSQRIRKVDTAGIITTVAGDGTAGFSGDGSAATSAQLNAPVGVAVDAAGNLFIVDKDNQRIRKVDTAGVITTIAGDGTQGSSGDGGLATAAQLNDPNGVAVDAAGNLFIADYRNERIRKVDTAGIITTIAGDGTSGFSGDDGAATAAQLNRPIGVGVDVAGNLFIADKDNSRIRKVDLAALACTYTLTPRRKRVDADGGTYTAQLATDNDTCAWRASSNDSWIRVLEPRGKILGIGNVTYEVLSNDSRKGRKGTIKIGPKSLTVRQAGMRDDDLGDPPTMPTDLQATRRNGTAVELTWKGVAGATGYKLNRRGKAYRGGAELLPAGQTRYLDRGLARRTRYCYILRAVNAAGTSDAVKVCIKTPR